MFFSLIRAPNQFSPKSKVVDLLSLYNFYFGQISCSHMKFGVLGSQTLLKNISNEFNSFTVLSTPAHAAGCSCASPGAPAARLGAAELPWPPCCPAPQPPWPIASKPGTPRRRPWPWWPWRGCAARLLL